MKARNLAVMLTDIKGFTDKTSRKSRVQIKELLTRHNELVLPVIGKYNGKLIKTIGDAFLVTFESSTDAVLCGISIQEALAAFNKGREQDDRIDIRIAINAGEVSISENGDIFGDAVNITSRIEGIAEAGEVFFTESVYLSMNKTEVPSSEIGYRQFKGISDKIKVYKVLKEDPVQPKSAVEADFTGEAASAKEPADPKPGPGSGSSREEKTGAKKEPEKADETVIKGMGGLSGMIMNAMAKSGMMQDVDIEDETGKKVKISGGEIHVIKAGKEIHIDKDGIRIRRIKKDKPGDTPKEKE
ncbi:MAG: adenylate/guanylate cyclase domain-containing protein [Elusimicrobia bacterium]|nr:adenylate/guanylate cyclase domain-containing protein [Elusimicrobiota bacterium]